MDSADRTLTVVLNILDGREGVFALSPEMAVVAAYEQFEKENFDPSGCVDPLLHPCFKVHRLGFSCGDWIAYRNGD